MFYVVGFDEVLRAVGTDRSFNTAGSDLTAADGPLMRSHSLLSSGVGSEAGTCELRLLSWGTLWWSGPRWGRLCRFEGIGYVGRNRRKCHSVRSAKGCWHRVSYHRTGKRRREKSDKWRERRDIEGRHQQGVGVSSCVRGNPRLERPLWI